MKNTIATIGLCVVFCASALAQSSPAAPDLSSLKWISQSKTVESFRRQNPQLDSIPDERLVVAIGVKFPHTLKMDSVFSNEFSALYVKPVPEPENQITTRNHVVYRSVTIIRVAPDGLNVSYTNSTGGLLITKLKFQDLSDELQEKYNYDPQRAAVFEMQQQQAELAMEQRLKADSRVATDAQNKWTDEALKQEQLRKQQEIDREIAEAQQKAAEAAQKQADAAAMEAAKPPVQMNQQQNVNIW